MSGLNAIIRYGFGRAEHVPGPMPWFPRWSGEELAMGRPGEKDPNITGSGNEGETEGLRADGTWKLMGACDSESWCAMRAHHHGWYEESAPAAGVNLIELRDFAELSDDPVPHYMDSLSMAAWRDVAGSPAEYMAQEARQSNFKLSAVAHKYIMVENSGLFLRDTYMGLPAEVAVNAAYTGGWERRGHRRAGDKAGPEIAWKVSTAGAVGVAKIKWGTAHGFASLTSVDTLATATTTVPHGLTTGALISITGSTPVEYNVVAVAITVTGASTFTFPIVDAGDVAATGTLLGVTFGTVEHLIVDDWMDVYTQADALKGTPKEPIQIRPTPETGDLFTLADAWRMAPRAPKPVAVVTTRGKLSATALELEFTIGGGATIRKVIQQFTLEMGRPREAKESVGSKYLQRIGTPENAEKWWEITFDRDLDDLDFEDARVDESRVTAYTKFLGTPIGSTGFDDFADFTFAAMKVTNAGGTITSPGDTPEKVTLRAFPSTAGAPLCVERWQNSVATIAPA